MRIQTRPPKIISGMKRTSGKVVKTARPLGKEVLEVDEDIVKLSLCYLVSSLAGAPKTPHLLNPII